jgi:acetolactate synthase-1/2/3 large subunit
VANSETESPVDANADGRTAHGFDILADVLVERYDAPIFGLLGDGNLAPIARAVELGATFVPSRHESAALGMATGYAISTGAVTVATTTRGPGVANAIVSLVSAARDGAPIVYIAGASGIGAAPAAQSLDQEAAVAPTGAGFVRVESAADLVRLTVEAFERARAERRPIVLSVPANILNAPAVEQAAIDRGSFDIAERRKPGPADRGLIAEAWRRLREARRPVILAGRGAVEAGARDALVELAEQSGALLISTLPVNGLFAGDPFDLGLCGGFALARTRALLDEADVVMAFGATLNRYTLAEGSLLTRAFLIHCDIDPDAIGRTRRADVGINADAAQVATAVLGEARNRPRPDAGYRTDEVRTRIEDTNFARDIPEQHGPDGVDPRGVLRVIDRNLPATRRIVVDVGHFSSFPCQVMPVSYPGQLLPAFGFGSVGLGISTAVGVSIGHPDEPVVAVIGDGGMLMSLGELDTVARVARRLAIVVMNDAAYGAEVHHLRHHGLPIDTAVFPRVDFAAVAQALGIDACRIDSPADFDRLARLGSLERPMLIDARINPAVVSDRFKQPVAGPASA